jgi:hypothetical protein
VDCNNAGGKHRRLTDYYDGSTNPLFNEQVAGCKADPCPVAGDACYTAIDLNAAIGGATGSITRAIGDVFYMKYVVPNGVNALVVDGCGSAGFFNPKLAIYNSVDPSSGD